MTSWFDLLAANIKYSWSLKKFSEEDYHTKEHKPYELVVECYRYTVGLILYYDYAMLIYLFVENNVDYIHYMLLCLLVRVSLDTF